MTKHLARRPTLCDIAVAQWGAAEMSRMTEAAGKVTSMQGRKSRSLSLSYPTCCPAGCYLTRSQIETVAETVAESVPSRAGADWLYEFVALSGGEIRMTPDAAHLLVAETTDRFVITATDIWAIAEALGHLHLHLDHIDPAEDAPPILAVPRHLTPVGIYARAGLEAGWFAPAFLMPTERFSASWLAFSGDLRSVANEFGLPMGTAASRAYRLGLAP